MNYKDFNGKVDLSKTIRDIDKLIKILGDTFVTDEGKLKGLNEYNNTKYSYLHGRLKFHKYIQNQPKKNTIDINPNAALWHNIYETLGQQNSGLSLSSTTIERQESDIKKLNEIKKELSE